MAEKRDYSEITPEIQALAAHCSEDCVIDKELYTKYKVNRGLRDLNGNGVLTGLTEISEIQAKTPDGESCDGSLFYRGYNVRDLVKGFLKRKNIVISAKRYGIHTVLIPKDNARDLEEIDQTVRAALRFIPVETVDQVFAEVFCPSRVETKADAIPAFLPVENSKEAALRQ